MKAIIFGGTGFIGKGLVESLDADEIAYFSRENANLNNKNAKWIKGDVTSYENVYEAVNGYDTIIYSVEKWEADETENRNLTLSGIKNIVEAVKKYDKDQKIVSFSMINQPSYPIEFFRTKRLIEDNTRVFKNGLVFRLPYVFGEGDHITNRLRKLSESVSRLPADGNLAPVHVEDVISVVKQNMNREGVYDISGLQKASLLDIVNAMRTAKGMREIGETKLEKGIKIVEETGLFKKYEAEMLFEDYSRETSILARYVKEPKSYMEFIRGREIIKQKMQPEGN
ncbi:MAG: NAD(P)H-binding protein [Thermoplasmata archaeon]